LKAGDLFKQTEPHESIDHLHPGRRLEAVLLATSRVKRARQKSGNPIRNLDTCVYVAFIRRFKRYLARQPKIQFVGSLQDVDTVHGIRTSKSAPTVEDEPLAKELLQYMNQRTQQLFYYSWKETARILKTMANERGCVSRA
jgi:hypothetical protein